MPTLVVGDDLLLGVGDDPALALGPGHDPLQGFLELGHADDLLVAPSRQDGCLVDEVGQVRAREAGRLAADIFDVDGLVERLALGVDTQDRDATLHVRAIEDDLPVEAAGPQQRRVEYVRSVCGGDHDHVRVRVEAVHLDQDLVQRLLALVVAAAEAGAALAADRIDLVHENDARAVALGLVEEVAHAAGADAHEHLDELRARNREERHARLAGDRPGHQGLAGAGRPDEQHAAGDASSQRVELLGVLEEFDDFLELGLGLVDARHVGERHDGLVAEEHAGATLAEAQGLVIRALGLAHHEDDEADDQDERQEPGDSKADPAGVGGLLGLEDTGRERLVPSFRRRLHVRIDLRKDARDDDRELVVPFLDAQGLVLLADRRHLAVLDVVQEVRISLRRRVGRLKEPGIHQRNGAEDEHQHDDAVAQEFGVQEWRPPVQRDSLGSGPAVDLCGEYSAGSGDDPMTVVRPEL